MATPLSDDLKDHWGQVDKKGEHVTKKCMLALKLAPQMYSCFAVLIPAKEPFKAFSARDL